MMFFVLVVPLITLVALVVILKRLLLVAAPNQLLVLSGSSSRSAGRVVGYRTIRGGRALRMPLLEQAHWLDLSNLAVTGDFEALAAGCLLIRVDLAAHVRPASEPPLVHQALENLLGRSRAELQAIARVLVAGVVRERLSATSLERAAFEVAGIERELEDDLAASLAKLGLVLDSLRIREINDRQGHLEALRRKGR